MREIKFRAWTGETMGEPFEVFDPVFLSAGGTFPKGTIFMQYTGLKDKNGKEIYEGDILEINGATAQVVFWEMPPEFGLNYYHNEDNWCEDWNICDDCGRMQVIGDIYQNPDLLK